MDRVIKFRGKIDGQWRYSWPDYDEEAHSDETYVAWGQFWEHADRETVGQFTGCYDRNWRAVYKGDVLGLDDPEDKSRIVIMFRDAAFKAELINHPGIFDERWSLDPDWIVIGNMYDNPDLLKRQ